MKGSVNQKSVPGWKDFWGRGLSTQALAAFPGCVTMRPLYAQAARDKFASIRVLEKCGFIACGKDKEFSHAREQVVEEVVLVLR
jgi:RimJ/RimL family protein N-acetyltransferase